VLHFFVVINEGVNLARSKGYDMPRTKKNPADVNFFSDVYDVVKLIPKGRVTSYGAIAHFLGAKSGARMVGWAMHGCPKGVPAHRVVNSIGLLTGKHHFKTPRAMQNLLEKEGISVINDQIKHFSDIFWDPAKELELR
jgi:methylated-DNA-protein-cysteine methyltransferase related protein